MLRMYIIMVLIFFVSSYVWSMEYVNSPLTDLDCYDINVHNGYCYVNTDFGMTVFDVSEISNPVKVNAFRNQSLAGFPFAGENLAVVNDSTAHLYDYSDPQSPVYIADFPYNAKRVIRSGNCLFMTFDHNNPTINYMNIYNFNGQVPVFAARIAQVGDFDISGDYLYIYPGLNSDERIDVYNLSNPAQPVLLSVNPLTMYIDSYYRITAHDNLIQMLSLTDEDSLQFISEIHNYDGADDSRMFVEGNYLYMDDAIINISNQTSPFIESTVSEHYSGPESLRGVFVEAGILWTADWTMGFSAYSLNVPSSPEPIIHYTHRVSPFSLARQGNYLYMGDYFKLYVFDISNPEHVTQVSSLDGVCCRDIAISDDKIYCVGDYQLHVADISNPLNPYLLATFDLDTGEGERILVDGNLLAVSSRFEGIVNIFEMFSPTDIQFRSSVNARFPSSMVRNGSYLYIVCSNSLGYPANE